MSITFTIGSHDSEGLMVGISDIQFEFVGFSKGSLIAITEIDGRTTVKVVSSDTVPVVQLSETQSEPLTQPVIDSKPTILSSLIQAETTTPDSADQRLFKHLVSLRRQIASEVGLPPYMIFHDTTLKEICRTLPTDLEAFSRIQGVGQAKLEKYGSRFIELISEYIKHYGSVISA
jgi:ATP-dependent DNA helicase RecQ